MEYDGINNVELNVEENQWLDVTYTAKKYLTEEEQDADTVRRIKNKTNQGLFGRFKRGFSNIFHAKEQNESNSAQRRKSHGGARKTALRLVISVAVLAILAVGVFVLDDTMDGQLVEMAKQTFLAPVFSSNVTPSGLYEISIPCTVSVEHVEDGIITFSGGSVLLSFTKGTVSATDESSITVAINDSTSIIYDNLTEILVNVGDTVDVYTVLAKYTESAAASILYNGELVINVVGSQAAIQWSV